jgi:hypothetical protein
MSLLVIQSPSGQATEQHLREVHDCLFHILWNPFCTSHPIQHSIVWGTERHCSALWLSAKGVDLQRAACVPECKSLLAATLLLKLTWLFLYIECIRDNLFITYHDSVIMCECRLMVTHCHARSKCCNEHCHSKENNFQCQSVSQRERECVHACVRTCLCGTSVPQKRTRVQCRMAAPAFVHNILMQESWKDTQHVQRWWRWMWT